MNLLKKKYWWFWLVAGIFSSFTSYIFLAYLLGCFDKNAWYAKPKNWIIGALCLFVPFVVMGYILMIEMACKCASKLGVAGSEIYLSPVIWLLVLCIPVLGWLAFMFMVLYVMIFPLIELRNGKAEKYIEG